MDIRLLYEEFIDTKKSYCEPDTIRYYVENVTYYMKWLQSYFGKSEIDVKDIVKKDYISYITFLRSRNIKNTSLRTYVRAVKVFLKYLFEEGYMDMDITRKVKLPRDDKAVKLPLSIMEVQRIDSCFNIGTYLGLRNYLIVHLMLDCGLRSGEVINLRVNDLNFEGKYLSVYKSKYNKSRVVPLNDNLVALLLKFIQHDKEYVFYDRYNRNRITSDSIKYIFAKLKKETDISRVHAHLLRHTFATSFILGGGSLEILRILMGHSDYNVTKEYLHIVAEIQILQYDIYKLDKCLFRNYNNY